MTLMEIIGARRSVRRYLDKPVEREKIELCLEAARLAPSACNAQPWRFLVVDEPELRERFVNKVFGGIYRGDFARKAPVIVAVVADQRSLASRASGAARNVSFALLDLGIAGEHFVLQAAELGLGTCWIGWFNEAAAKRALGVPRGKKIVYLLSLGYPAGESARPHPRKTMAEMATFNGWR